MKKNILTKILIIALTIVIAMTLALPSFAENENSVFTDVKSGAWYEKSVYTVSRKGLMNGNENDFRPNDEITRSELVTILARFSEEQAEYDRESPFSDVSINSWYGPSVIWAAKNEIVNGIGNRRFAPKKALTREELCTILVRYFDYKKITLPSDKSISFNDYEKTSVWAKDAVKICASAGFIDGFPDGNFLPKNKVQRAQVAKIFSSIIRMNLNKTENLSATAGGGAPMIEKTPYTVHSADELRNLFENYPNISFIKAYEKDMFTYLIETCSFSTDELKNGIVKSCIDEVLENGLLVPKIGDEAANISSGIKFTPYSLCRRPSFSYSKMMGVDISITLFDGNLKEEASEKGVSWLIKELDDGQLNVHNQERIIEILSGMGIDQSNLSVYEKSMKINEKTVNVLIYEYSGNNFVQAFTVCENAIVKVDGSFEDIENALNNLVLERVKI